MDRTQFIEVSVRHEHAVLSRDGALLVKTGASTGRSTKERFVVQRPEIMKDVDWGNINQPIDGEFADAYFAALKKRVVGGQHFCMNGYVGSFPIEVVSTSPWHILFAKNMFRRHVIPALAQHIPDDVNIEIWHDPHGKVSDLQLGREFPFEKAIIVDLAQLKVGIIGTAYAGEVKKSAFSVCNYLMPKYGIFPMHASANCMEDGDESSVLFGLSGTGKTTLSADPERFLIGDDEIVWSPTGISNLEGGCYAKLINLKESHEPDIYQAANKFGSILENVAFNEHTREIDFCDSSITENTRGSYSLDVLTRVFDQTQEAKPPKSIVFLTADAFGALPAVARLNPWQAQYHFISGYTAKLAGTEIGVTEPQAAFSACFGAPFMPRSPSVYAGMMAEMAKKYDVTVWLLNTGWTKGGYGKGERFPIPVSRRLLRAIQSGELNKVQMQKHPIFGFDVPVEVPGVDPEWLSFPQGPQVMELAKRFIANAESKKSAFTAEIVENGGPKVNN
ncbi:MAG: phosphoenolpyruvate carboxykinase (ATP) [Bdellovibrionales bacterium]|nr:phosphoenolpyruvate carboxykinase (ATP) [Bdellovibrionales bacterium]